MTPLRIPSDQLARQAVAGLQGYVFQLYLSALEWAELQEGEELLLEVAEDYARLVGSTLTMTQAKSDEASGPVTLRRSGAVKLIKSIWEFQNGNPDLTVRAVYLTTSKPGKEQGYRPASGNGAIDDWQAHANGSGDMGALRQLLRKLKLPQDLLDFIATASDEDLRDRIVRPVKWVCGAPPLDEVRFRLEERLAALAQERHLLRSDGKAAASTLLEQIVKSIGSAKRRLSHADFTEAFERATTVPVSIGVARAAMVTADTARVPLRTSPASSSNLVVRQDLKDAAVDRLLTSGRAVLIGMGGSGKTELAADVSRDPRINERFPDGVLWASIGQRQGVGPHLGAWLALLGAHAPQTDDVEMLAAAWRGALSGRQVLVVVDDLWRVEHLNPLLPPTGCGLLVTGRPSMLAATLTTDAIEVGELEADEARALLLTIAGPKTRDASRADVDALAARLKRTALPLVLAGTLMRDGRPPRELALDLADEELRLSALDLGDRDPSSEDALHRSTSMEACLGLSVRALDDRCRAAFYRLAVLPEATEIEPRMAASLLATSGAAAKRLLDALVSRGVLSSGGVGDSRAYRLHDLLLEYARTGFGTARTRIAPVSDELPGTLRELHGELLDRLAAAASHQGWASIDDVRYYDLHLGWHMVQADRAHLLHDLLRERDREGRPSWLARVRRRGGTALFLGEVARAFGAAARDLVAANGDARSGAVADAVVACSVLALIVHRATRTPVGLLPPLVAAGWVTVEEALTQARIATGVVRAFLLAELLPLASASTRWTVWREFLQAALVGGEFAMIGDEMLLGILIPTMDDRERRDLLPLLPLLSPFVQARVLAGMHASGPSAVDVEISRLKSEPLTGRAHHARNAGLIHLAAAGVPTGLKAAELIALVKECVGFDDAARAIFVVADELDLAGAIRGVLPDRLRQLLDPFERHRRHLPILAVVEAISVAQKATDAGERAVLMSRICALAGDDRTPELAASALAMLLALDDSDFRKAHGLGIMIPLTTGTERRATERAFVNSGAAVGFGSLGSRQLCVISAGLGPDAMRDVIACLRIGSAFDRQITLAALLENATGELAVQITLEIIDEARRSGGIGDMRVAGRCIPPDLLLVLQEAVRLLPPQELVAAVRDLVGPAEPIPDELSGWIADGWSETPPDHRLLLAEHASFHSSADEAVHDVELCLFGSGAPIRDRRAALEAAPRALSRLSRDDVRTAVENRLLPRLASLSDGGIVDMASLSVHLTEDEASALASRAAAGLEPVNAARALAAIAVGAERLRRPLMTRAAEILAGAGDGIVAADWAAEHGSLLDTESAAPLLGLRGRIDDTQTVHSLATALYRLLPPQEQEDLPNWLIHLKPLTPMFIDKLKSDEFPSAMRTALEICRFHPHAQPSPSREMLLQDATRFLQGDARVAAMAIDAFPHAQAVTVCVDLLRSGAMLGLPDFCAVLRRLAPNLTSALGRPACIDLAARITSGATLYGAAPSPKVADPSPG